MGPLAKLLTNAQNQARRRRGDGVGPEGPAEVEVDGAELRVAGGEEHGGSGNVRVEVDNGVSGEDGRG